MLGVRAVVQADVSADEPRRRQSPQGGASIYDVRTTGVEGGSGKADEVRELSKGGCVNLRTRGGRGSKNLEILRTS